MAPGGQIPLSQRGGDHGRGELASLCDFSAVPWASGPPSTLLLSGLHGEGDRDQQDRKEEESLQAPLGRAPPDMALLWLTGT